MELSEKLFKFSIIILGIIFLFILYQWSQNGRYEFDLPIIKDTRTGKLYIKASKEMNWTLIDPVKEGNNFQRSLAKYSLSPPPDKGYHSNKQDKSLDDYSLSPPLPGKHSPQWGDLSNFPLEFRGWK
jgi:hypothetical protein